MSTPLAFLVVDDVSVAERLKTLTDVVVWSEPAEIEQPVEIVAIQPDSPAQAESWIQELKRKHTTREAGILLIAPYDLADWQTVLPTVDCFVGLNATASELDAQLSAVRRRRAQMRLVLDGTASTLPAPQGHDPAAELARRSLQELDRYAELFATLAGGIVAIGRTGRFLFANAPAREILGASEHTLAGLWVSELLHPSEQKELLASWRTLAESAHTHAIDVRVKRLNTGEWRVCRATFSNLRYAPGAVLVSLDDVTEQRRTEAEFVRMTKFFESLIDASVDAIIAADLKGNVILFNHEAERIYGYSVEEVVGKLTVRDLYPEGEAQDIMRRLLSEESGVGRLAATESAVIGKGGERIPIRLSAAVIFEDGKPSATFGFFTDLRERRQMERRLEDAQRRLKKSEKHALVAELAGTAAHELNQPLTSVMAYAELLARKLEDGTPEHRAATVMYREAERMADIVRKIGKISRYETTDYVGAQRILDLDKASDDLD